MARRTAARRLLASTNMVGFVLLLLGGALCYADLPRPSHLRVENVACPVVGVDEPQPRFSWQLALDEWTRRGTRQEAFQIVVWDASQDELIMWDSGVVASSEVTHHRYNGKPLRSLTPYRWRVRCWDQNGVASPWSEPASLHTGLLPLDSRVRGDALASPLWIGGNNLLRREFTVPQGFASATIVISGVGYYELFLNGNKVGDHKLDPGWTHYAKRVLYVTYDVTQLLSKTGVNAVGVMLGGGWYRQGEGGDPALYFELRVNTAAGQQQSVLVSDSSWSVAQSPVLSDGVYNGELYDARLEQVGWDRAGFKGNWPNATVVNGPAGMLRSQMFPPIKVMNVLKPVSRSSPVVDVVVFDFGQTMSGWCKIRVKGPRGTTVTLRYAEVLSHDGSGMPNFENLRSALATDIYILKGDPNGEEYAPRFTYHGFRFVQVVSSNFWQPGSNDIEAHQVYSSVASSGHIQFFSDPDGPAPILNRLHQNIWWGQASNLMSLPTDCNQRDERLGWTADAQLSAEEALHNFDLASFYTNWMNLMQDDQENRTVTNVVPNVRFPGRPADPAWGAAFPLVTYWVWKYTGDLDIVRQHYTGIRDWIDYLGMRASATGLRGMFGDYGDWVPPPPAAKVSISFTSSWYYLYNVKVFVEMATSLMGPNSTDAISYGKLYGMLVNEFNAAFYDATAHTYDRPLQTSYVLPLWLGLVPPTVNNTRRVHINLLNDIVVNQNTHLSTGIIGTKYLLPALSKFGRTDLALQLATQTTYPSWAYMWMQNVETPATTLWELWNAPTGSPVMDSRNHIMFGSVGDWMYQTLAGIRQAENSTGYREILFHPPPSNVLLFSGLRGVNASVEWMMGTIASQWMMADDGSSLLVRVSVPSQSVAHVTIPLLDYSAFVITEGARTVWRDNAFVPGAPGVVGARASNEAVVFTVVSGRYEFRITNGKRSTMTCGEAGEGQALTLSCPQPGQVMSVVSFASFGNPTGGFQCAAYAKGSCDAGSSAYVVEQECLWKNSCRVLASEAVFGKPCGGVKTLRAAVLCSDSRLN